MSSFRSLVYSEIEEIGWEHLVRSNDNLSFLSFRLLDKKERVHILEIQLHDSYPQHPPSISAEVPYICDLKWSASSRLKDVIQQFQKHLEKLQELWDILDTVDKFLWVVGPEQPSHATTYRQINLGNGCSVMLYLDPTNPRCSPECRVIGPDSSVSSLMKMWRRNSKKWSIEKDLTENLKSILEIQVPRPPDAQDDQITECGICYAQSLPTDEGFGAQSGSRTDYTCENTNCSRAFHTICLGDWLQSITTTRRSYDVLFGNCPYCSEPVAVKFSATK
ncbi:hypothetical protein V2J09_001890 [Rumex salicifolius]